jgi:GNAT superfamily N-acetyltransferase
MRFYVEQAPRGSWRVMLHGADAPVSEHDTEEEAQERVAAYLRGIAAAAAPTVETGIARGDRVRLRDGSEVIVRPVEPEDKPLLLEGFRHFSDSSRYQRFMAPKKRLTPRELAYFTDIDHVEHEAIGALDPGTGHGVGVARFIRERPGGEIAEAAVAVVDAFQGRGLGGVLLERLARRATEVGVTAFSAALLTDNRAMLALFARLGRMEVRHDSGSTARLTVCLDIDRPGALRDALRAAASGEVGA